MHSAVQFQSSADVHSSQRIHSNKPWWAVPGNCGFPCGHPSPRGECFCMPEHSKGKSTHLPKLLRQGLIGLFSTCINASISRSSASKLPSAPRDFSAPSGDPQQLLVLPESLQNCLLWIPGACLLDHGAAACILSPSNQNLFEIEKSPVMRLFVCKVHWINKAVAKDNALIPAIARPQVTRERELSCCNSFYMFSTSNTISAW